MSQTILIRITYIGSFLLCLLVLFNMGRYLLLTPKALNTSGRLLSPAFLVVTKNAQSGKYELLNLVNFTVYAKRVRQKTPLIEEHAFSPAIKDWSHAGGEENFQYAIPTNLVSEIEDLIKVKYQSTQMKNVDESLNLRSIQIKAKEPGGGGQQNIKITVFLKDSVGVFLYDVQGDEVIPLGGAWLHINLFGILAIGSTFAAAAISYIISSILRKKLLPKLTTGKT